MRRRAAFGLWCVALAVTLWALHVLGSAGMAVPPSPWDWGEWSSAVEPAVLIVSLIRLVALACAWYLAVVTVVGAIGRRSGTPGFVSAVDSVTPAFLRVMLASARGLTLSAAGLSLALTPLLAGGDEVSVASAGTNNVATQPDPPDAPVSATLREIQFQLGPIASADVDTDTAAPATNASQVWVVETGDHFWAIAEETLIETWDRAPTDAEIAAYWQVLVQANESQLRVPGNPDLIYPGQVVTLPPVPA